MNDVIMVDANGNANGSTDASLEVIREYSNRYRGLREQINIFRRMTKEKPLNPEDIASVFLFGRAGVSQGTMKRYSGEFHQFYNVYLGAEFLVPDLTAQHLHGFFGWRQKHNRSVKYSPEDTARASCTAVVSTLRVAEKNCPLFADVNPYHDFAKRNPDLAKQILTYGGKRKEWKVRERALTFAQWETAMRAIDRMVETSPRKSLGGALSRALVGKSLGESKQFWAIARAMVWLAWSGALRISEAVKLRFGDLYDEENGKPYAILRDPKAHKGENVPQELLTRKGINYCYEAWRIVRGTRPGSNDHMIPQLIQRDKPPHKSTLLNYQRTIGAYLKENGILPIANNSKIYSPGKLPFNFHTWRHTCLQMLADERDENGKMPYSFEWLRHFARHENAETTRQYCDTSQEIGSLAVNLIKRAEGVANGQARQESGGVKREVESSGQ